MSHACLYLITSLIRSPVGYCMTLAIASLLQPSVVEYCRSTGPHCLLAEPRVSLWTSSRWLCVIQKLTSSARNPGYGKWNALCFKRNILITDTKEVLILFQCLTDFMESNSSFNFDLQLPDSTQYSDINPGGKWTAK